MIEKSPGVTLFVCTKAEQGGTEREHSAKQNMSKY